MRQPGDAAIGHRDGGARRPGGLGRLLLACRVQPGGLRPLAGLVALRHGFRLLEGVVEVAAPEEVHGRRGRLRPLEGGGALLLDNSGESILEGHRLAEDVLEEAGAVLLVEGVTGATPLANAGGVALGQRDVEEGREVTAGVVGVVPGGGEAFGDGSVLGPRLERSGQRDERQDGEAQGGPHAAEVEWGAPLENLLEPE